MRINPFLFGVLVLVIFMGTILGFQAAGIWSVSGKVTSDGQAVQPSAADVDTIKGWMTLEQITTTFNIPLTDLLSQFGLPADTPAATAIKDLETESFSVTNLRAWLLTGQNGSAGSPALQTSTPRIISTMTPTPGPTQPSSNETHLPAPTVNAAADTTITGKTTIQELLDWGVSKEVIQTVIGGTLPPGSTVVKDYVTGKGLEFSPIKTTLQAEIDQLK